MRVVTSSDGSVDEPKDGSFDAAPRAFELFARAFTEHAHAQSAYNAGCMLWIGYAGLPQDRSGGKDWIKRAADAGCFEARV